MTKNEYNGWFNYETWVVSLWIDNERGSHDRLLEEAKRCLEECDRPETRFSNQTREEAAAIMLADILKSEHEESMPEVSGVFADLLNAAMSEVNWYEIAEHVIEDVKENVV